MATPAERLQQSLSHVRGLAAGGGGDASGMAAQIGAHFDALAADLELILREHAGMAEELLLIYEQLGVVFDVTRKLATVQSEDEVIGLFMDSVRAVYSGNRIGMLEPQGALWRWHWPEDIPIQTAGPLVEACRNERRVEVHKIAAPNSGLTEMLVAPIFAGDAFVGSFVLAHGELVRPFQSGDMSLLEALTHFCGDLVRTYRLTHELQQMSMGMVRALVNAVDQKDEYTSGHSTRVARYAVRLARAWELPVEELTMLEWSALLHDVGKIGIRDDVLKKPGRLTKEEFDHIKEHPVRGWEVVRAVPQLKAALPGIRHHHERFDGKGYPDGIAGHDIPMQARIILVADVFDALTTNRAYRKAFTVEKALAILEEEAGLVGDPKLVELFVKLIREDVAQRWIPVDEEGCVVADAF